MSRKTGIIVALVVLLAAGGGGGWMYHNAQLDKMRTAGIEALQASVSLEDYRDEQKKEVEKILSESEQRINESKDQDSIDSINKEAADKISKIRTDAELDVEEGIEKLRNSVSLDDYREEQKSEVEAILDDTEKAIKEASGDKKINKLIKEAEDKIAEVKTDAQLTAEEEAARQAAAAASRRSSSGSGRQSSGNSQGCIGNDASNFY